jgi:lipopolysaccharide/colanic/teichoic acid biosynthesis glycosyltransferase
MLKLVFDYILAVTGLIVFTPLLVTFALLIKIDSPGPVFFRQERMGKNGRIFYIHKFRTMYSTSDNKNPLTSGTTDSRITRIGRLIRKFHLDEVVQLIDVLSGHMSVVGPRPEVSRYTKYYQDKWDEILQVKPGITGLAAIKLAQWEYDKLKNVAMPDQVYIKKILPRKLRLEKIYVARQSLLLDMKIIFATICYIFKG